MNYSIPEAVKSALYRNPYSSPSSAIISGITNMCIEKIFAEYDRDWVISAWGISRRVAPGCNEALAKLIKEEDLKPVYVNNSDADEDLENLDSGCSVVYASLERRIAILTSWDPCKDYRDEENPDLYGGRCSCQVLEPFNEKKSLLANKIRKIFDSHRAVEKSCIYTIVTSNHGYCLEALGIGGTPLIRDNYSPEVQESYQQIVEDLHSKDPLGRLSIVCGQPGTGKTYLIRGLVDEVPECKFVIVPPHLVSHLGDPEFLAFFIRERADEGHDSSQPLVLILEDADICLTERAADNMSSISALLNLTDGIVGSLLNFRIIATTNAKKVELDPALQRAGRLSVSMTVDELAKEQIAEIYMRLTKSEDYDLALETTSNCFTLADVYAAAKGAKKSEKKSKRTKVVGFGR